eukprot:2823569-Amphidinium_carterae.1
MQEATPPNKFGECARTAVPDISIKAKNMFPDNLQPYKPKPRCTTIQWVSAGKFEMKSSNIGSH